MKGALFGAFVVGALAVASHQLIAHERNYVFDQVRGAGWRRGGAGRCVQAAAQG